MDTWKAAYILVLFSVVGVRGQGNDIGYFWHVTDFHYDHTYGDYKLSCNSNVPASLPPYGDYWCDATWKLVTDSIKAMASIKPDVDFLLWTGDSVAHISDDNLSLALNLQVLSNITSALKNSFNSTKVYATLGNHDFFPSGQASPNVSDSFYGKVTDIWQEWVLNQSDAVSESRKGGYYAVNVQSKLRLLALNTNLYYTSDKLTSNTDDPVGQFSWMTSQLQQAKDHGEKVIVTGHVPPGLFFPGYADWYWPKFKTTFMKIILNYTDVIVALHFGHDHYDSFKVLEKDDGSGGVPQFTAPSVTPWRYKIKVNGADKIGDSHNPGLRLVKFNRTSGAHLDYAQYFINITEANNASGTAQWQVLYNFTTAYDVPDMGLNSVKSIFTKLKDNNSPLYQKFCNYWVVSNVTKPCTDQMKADIWCGGQFYMLERANQCSAERLKPPNGEPPVRCAVPLILLMVVMKWVM